MLESERSKELSKEALVSIISSLDLRATEEKVFESTMRWGEAVVAQVGGVVDAVDGYAGSFGAGDC